MPQTTSTSLETGSEPAQAAPSDSQHGAMAQVQNQVEQARESAAGSVPPSIQMNEAIQSAGSVKELYEKSFIAFSQTQNVVSSFLEVRLHGTICARKYQRPGTQPLKKLLEIARSLSANTQVDAKSIAKVLKVGNHLVTIRSAPLIEAESGTCIGTLTQVLEINNKDEAADGLKQLETFTALLTSAAKKIEDRPRIDPKKVRQQKAIIRSANYGDVRELGFAIVNSVCQKLDCEQTSMGLVEGGKVKMLAISGMDNFTDNSPAIIDISQAMEECLDANKQVLVQHNGDVEAAKTDNYLLHRRWHQETAGASVCSLPIQSGGKTIAVLSMKRNFEKPFSDEDLTRANTIIESFAPAIELMRKASRSLSSHMMAAGKEFLSDTVFAKTLKGKVLAFGTLLAAAAFLFAPMPYTPTIPCTIQPSKVTHLVAPFAGTIQQANLVAGDRVKRGDLIIQFDTRLLELERNAISSDIGAQTIARDQAISERELAQAQVHNAQINVLRAKLESLNFQIEKGTIRAENDGTVLRGDLRTKIGQTAPQGKPLMEVAPDAQLKIQLEVPESHARFIKVGGTGTFASVARPGEKFTCEIVRLTPSAEVVNGKNVILAEARVTSQNAEIEWMRVGMEGYAKVDAGWQPIRWVALHQLWDSLRLNFWL